MGVERRLKCPRHTGEQQKRAVGTLAFFSITIETGCQITRRRDRGGVVAATQDIDAYDRHIIRAGRCTLLRHCKGSSWLCGVRPKGEVA